MEITKVKETLENLKVMVERFRKDSRSFDEENTKMSLIIPFFIQLGYNTYDPYEFTSELLADCRTNGSDKVDYSILVNGQPKVIIEAKRFNTALEPHIGQLQRYFNVKADIRYGILTNGTDYYFFTDTKHSNMMDDEPFYRLNIENVSDEDLDFLKHFAKDSILGNDDDLKEYIGKNKLRQALKALLVEPTDEFVDFVKKQTNQSDVTKEDIRDCYAELTTKQVTMPKDPTVNPTSVPVKTVNTPKAIVPQKTTAVVTTPKVNRNLSVVKMDVELLGHKFSTKKWVELFISSLEILVKEKPSVMGQLNSLFPQQKVTKFSYDIKDFPAYETSSSANTKQLSNGMFAFVRLSSSAIESILHDVIEICGLSKDELKVTKHLKDGTTV